MKHSTVLFDFDGTLLYTIPDLADAVNFALEKYGYQGHDYATIQSFVGNGVRLLVSRALPEGEDNPDFPAVFSSFNEYYDAHCVDKTAPYDGIMQALAALSDAGVKMAIVTNKYQQAAEELRERFFGRYIPIIEGDIDGRERKPDPAPVMAAIKALGVEKKDCIYVGDTEVDMRTAANSGIDFCAVAWGYRSPEQLEALGIKTIARDPGELISLI